MADRATQLLPFVCAGFLSNPAAFAQYPEFEGHSEQAGRSVWMENCEGCHAYGIAGAPIPSNPEEWLERLKQPMETLHKHAIQGFYGENDTFMPARGGNSNLTDQQVVDAVNYMIRLVRFHHQPHRRESTPNDANTD